MDANDGSTSNRRSKIQSSNRIKTKTRSFSVGSIEKNDTVKITGMSNISIPSSVVDSNFQGVSSVFNKKETNTIFNAAGAIPCTPPLIILIIKNNESELEGIVKGKKVDHRHPQKVLIDEFIMDVFKSLNQIADVASTQNKNKISLEDKDCLNKASYIIHKALLNKTLFNKKIGYLEREVVISKIP